MLTMPWSSEVVHCRADMTSFSAGGQGIGSEEGVVHQGEMMNVKQDSMC